MNPKQCEIWLVDLNPTRGQEINKRRTCVVVSDDAIGKLKNKTVVPLTEWKEVFELVPWMIKIDKSDTNNLDKTSASDTFQIRNLSTERFIKKIGVIESVQLFKIHESIVKTLNISYSIK